MTAFYMNKKVVRATAGLAATAFILSGEQFGELRAVQSFQMDAKPAEKDDLTCDQVVTDDFWTLDDYDEKTHGDLNVAFSFQDAAQGKTTCFNGVVKNAILENLEKRSADQTFYACKVANGLPGLNGSHNWYKHREFVKLDSLYLFGSDLLVRDVAINMLKIGGPWVLSEAKETVASTISVAVANGGSFVSATHCPKGGQALVGTVRRMKEELQFKKQQKVCRSKLNELIIKFNLNELISNELNPKTLKTLKKAVEEWILKVRGGGAEEWRSILKEAVRLGLVEEQKTLMKAFLSEIYNEFLSDSDYLEKQ